MFHGWMFDSGGQQAAADSTRSSTSLDTGWSLNPRTARRLVTASYTSMIASLRPSVSFNTWGELARSNKRLVVPKRRYATKDIAGEGHVADGRERQVCSHQRLAVRRQLSQKNDPHTRCLHGALFETVGPVGRFELDLEHRVAGESQPRE